MTYTVRFLSRDFKGKNKLINLGELVDDVGLREPN